MKEKKYCIYLKGEDKTDSVRAWRRIGDKYEVTFHNGKSFHYNLNNVEIVESSFDEENFLQCFDYLKQIANEVGIKVELENRKTINILFHHYSKIEYVESDVMAAFLNGKFTTSFLQENPLVTDAIYPFGFNVSQKDAVEKALSNPLSIIEGPPGTGKTQTILNIIANIVIRGETVAIVSSNNSATKNVFDKLRKNNVDFAAACLGSIDNKTDFINSQKPLPDMSSWHLSSDAICELKDLLKQRSAVLQNKLLQQQKLSSLKQELSAIETEIKYFFEYANNFENIFDPQISRKINTAEKALEMWFLCESHEETPSRKNIVAYFKYIFRYFKFFNKRKLFIRGLLKKYSVGSLIILFQRRFYEMRMAELNQNIIKLNNELKLFNFKEQMNEYTEISLKIFRASLAGLYQEKQRKNYLIEDLRYKSQAFIKDYPVILSTTYSLRSSLAANVTYDYVIIDESSQVDLCTGALALSCAKKAVVVGDLKQLSHVVDSKMAKITDEIFSNYNLPEFYRYKNHSLLSSFIEMFPTVPKTLLREHYRCHPKIIEFCNKKFYGGQLVILSDYMTDHEPLIVYKTVEGNHERKRMNQRQIDIIKNEIIPQLSLNVLDNSLGIITPYRNQTNALQEAFSGLQVKADTVDKFQGQENEFIILSTVDNEITEFADNAKRLNVAISRAVKQLIVVVNDSDTLKDTNIGDLVRYIEYNNHSIVESRISSIFDYLYKGYADRRREFLKKYKSISEYESENLMYAFLSNILKEKEMNCLEVIPHVSLRMIIGNMELMLPAEKTFAMNPRTHVDFLVCDTVSKFPKFAIEVDGVGFHAKGSKQAERDSMKDEIFKKYNIPLLRFKTDGSSERERLMEALLMYS